MDWGEISVRELRRAEVLASVFAGRLSAPDDLIDHLAGIDPGSRLDRIRNQRPAARENAQKSFLALFAPVEPEGLSLRKRFAIAAFVAGLHEQPATFSFYSAELVAAGAAEDFRATQVSETQRGAARGHYGVIRLAGSAWTTKRAPPIGSARTPARCRATGSLQREHAHLLIFHPRDAEPEAFVPLLAAGWTTDAIVTLRPARAHDTRIEQRID